MCANTFPTQIGQYGIAVINRLMAGCLPGAKYSPAKRSA
jgi:hypothetical protein